MGQPAAVVGREPELGWITRAIDSVRNGPSALLLEGVAGIGKTTLWRAGAEHAASAGMRLLQTRAGQSEATLSFTALGDLIGPYVVGASTALPPPQRQALETALLLSASEGRGPDPRAVSLAALAVLRHVAGSAPTILAIDDLQWLDPPSARVLEFCVRRLRDEPIGLLASVRVGEDDERVAAITGAIPGDRIAHVQVGPLPEDQLARLILERTGGDLPRPVLARIGAAAAGNPFFALEIAREVQRRGVPAPTDPLPIPGDLTDLLRSRVETLPRGARELLLVAASASRPTEELLRSAGGLGPRTDDALAAARDAGMIELGRETIAFTHPLVASAAVASATLSQRRLVHRHLAELVQDPEERARHLALAATGPDPQVAVALDDAVRQARSRGAPESAAELAELARRLTPAEDVDGLLRRTELAADAHFDAGDVTTSFARFEEAIVQARPGSERAHFSFRLGSHSWMNIVRVRELCERALAESPDDAEIVGSIHEHLAWVDIYEADLPAASAHIEEALEHARRIEAPMTRAEILATSAMIEFLRGRRSEDAMVEAERLEDLGAPGERGSVATPPRTNHGLQLMWAGELDAARETLLRQLDVYDRDGIYLMRFEPLGYLAEIECRAGRIHLADRYAEEGAEIQLEAGHTFGYGHGRFTRVLVAALAGDGERAREHGDLGLRISAENGDPFYANATRWALGLFELSRPDPRATLGWLEPVLAYLDRLASPEPGVIPCVPDAIEALVALGELERARDLLERHETTARASARPFALATAGRCRALMLAATGDLEGAVEATEAALREHERSPQALEHARTLLVRGEVERRARRKAPARAFTEDALRRFEETGARLWAARARGALERVGGAAVGPTGLTPTERRVAELVVEGRTNREVAEAMFISVKTVEANLSRVYHKLGVRSRAELIRRSADEALGS